MDIKSKSSKIIRNFIITIIIAAVVVGNLYLFPKVEKRITQYRENNQQEETEELDRNQLQTLYRGTHVLYLEALERENGTAMLGRPPSEILASDNPRSYNPETNYETSENQIDMIMEEWQDGFNTWFRNQRGLDYCILRPDTDKAEGTSNYVISEKTTEEELEKLVEELDTSTEKKLREKYRFYITFSFDEKGSMQISNAYDKRMGGNVFSEAFQSMSRDKLADYDVPDYYINNPRNTKIVYAMTEEGFQNLLIQYDMAWDNGIDAYREVGTELIFAVSVAVLAILGLLLKKKSRTIEKKRFFLFQYPLLLAAAGIFGVLQFGIESYLYIVREINQSLYLENMMFLGDTLSSQQAYLLVNIGDGLLLFGMYLIWYLAIASLRPVFSLGLMGYYKEKTMTYQIYSWTKKKWGKCKEEIQTIDLREKQNRKIAKVLLINYVILAGISCFWILAVFPLVIYSLFLFFYARKYYGKIQSDYNALLEMTNQIAEGKLDSTVEENIGVFEPIKEELYKIQEGLKKAVEEEVKSQRMKTELITNVSHDLKTPLTAITTYVELLKGENITEEERNSYIETLEKKALRLKVLIEDLFEVSKANSNDITLNKAEVDIINLLKQVSIEYKEKMEEKGLEVKWEVPEEKIVLLLDSQKTYRIFENLFVNICKYSLSNTRVYIEVSQEAQSVCVVMKNISAGELKFKADEISERFVRGDEARNTEGSGLGLAIAKSFAEAQGGTFTVSIDGDLFKVKICWHY